MAELDTLLEDLESRLSRGEESFSSDYILRDDIWLIMGKKKQFKK